MKPPILGLGASLSVLEAAAAEMFSISDLKLNPFLGIYWGNIRVHIGVVLGYWTRKWKLRFSYIGVILGDLPLLMEVFLVSCQLGMYGALFAREADT